MGLDLHTHSLASDGSQSPREIVIEAQQLGLDGLAITDHDTVDGLSEAVETGRILNYPVIPGIELTTDHGDQEVHILGYAIDWQAPHLLEKLRRIIDAREERARGMVERLRRAGVHLSWEAVRQGAPGKFIGRPHIYRAMREAGIIGDDPLRKAFDYYLGNHGVAYLPHREIETFEAIELILSVGGLPVLAHPGRMTHLHLLPALCESGLIGLEVYYPSHTPPQVKRFLKLAESHRLLSTGGSDYHGLHGRSRLGEAQAPAELLSKLHNRL